MVNLSQNKNVKLNNVCLYLLVIATTVGPVIYLGVAALYHFVIAGLLLMVLYKGTNTGNYKTSIMTFLLLWLFEAAISFLWAPDKIIVLKYVYYIFQINTTCILFHYFLSRENIETFSQFMVLVLLACNLIAFWEVKTGNHLLTNYLSTPLRMRVLKYVPCAFFLNPNGLATFIVQLIPFSFWSMSSSKKWVRIISSVNVVVSFFSICAAQSRTQIILCLVMCAVFVLLFYKKYLLKYGLFVFAIAILLYFIIPDFNNLIDSALKSVTGDR